MDVPSVVQHDLTQNKTAGEFVFERIKREIMIGNIVPGQRLVERELTEQFQISRTPVREALKLLVRTQLAVNIPYRGVEVRRLSLSFARNIYDLRRGTEGMAAYLAAERATRDEIEKLERIFSQIGEQTRLGIMEDVMLLNNRFHRAIAEATHNDLLVERVDELWTNVNLLRGAAWYGNRRTDASHQEHGMILSAILNRESEIAQKAVDFHIRQSWHAVEHAMTVAREAGGNDDVVTPPVE